jgi:hypothetical protein
MNTGIRNMPEIIQNDNFSTSKYQESKFPMHYNTDKLQITDFLTHQFSD